MKKVFNVFLMSCLLATSMCFMAGCKKDEDKNAGSNKINLDKNVDGADLTKDFCMNLVQNYWDCSNGAMWYSTGYNGLYQWYRGYYGCESGGKGNLLMEIEGFFSEGGKLNTERSYYKYRILYLDDYKLEDNGDWWSYSITVYF